MNSQFGDWLNAQLEERGWSQSELARRCNVTSVAISLVVNGERNPGPELCRAIAAALGLPEEKVFRLAGLLSQLPVDDETLVFQDVYEMMKNLTPAERREVLEYVTWRYQQRKKAATAAEE